MGAKEKRYTRIERYDGIDGKWIRDVRPTDLFTLNIANKKSSTLIASTIVGANFNLFVTGIDLGCVSTSKQLAILENATTRCVLPMQGIKLKTLQSQHPGQFLFKIAASSTLKIKTIDSASTYTVALYGVRVPINSKLETA